MERKPRITAGKLPGLIRTYLASFFVTPDVRELPPSPPPDSGEWRMSEEIETRAMLQAEIAHNYKQMEAVRATGETVLVKTFEQRMNGGLGRLMTFNTVELELAAMATSAIPGTAVVLFERHDGENIQPGEN